MVVKEEEEEEEEEEEHAYALLRTSLWTTTSLEASRCHVAN